jgi:hypothetical protein
MACLMAPADADQATQQGTSTYTYNITSTNTIDINLLVFTACMHRTEEPDQASPAGGLCLMIVASILGSYVNIYVKLLYQISRLGS